MKKFIAVAVCAGMLFNSGINAAPAFAAENFSREVVVSSIPEGNAYIPKGIIL